MSNLPFGFGPSDRDPDDENGDGEQPVNPFAAFGLGDLGNLDLSALGNLGNVGNLGNLAGGGMPLFAELGKLLSGEGGPVNWDLARQLANSAVQADSAVVGEVDRTAVRDAVRLADLWLDDVTDLPSGVTTSDAWSRSDWVARTLDGWAMLCDPVASRVVGAMGQALPAEMASQLGPLGAIMGRFGGLMFGAQVGQGIAGLATETVSSTEIGLPLGPVGTAALLPQNVRALATQLERPEDEVRLYLALREAATHRLYHHASWLRAHVVEAVEAYSKGITIDASALQDVMGRIDPTNPESMQAALGEGMFTPEDTPQQRAALARLETVLALVEGWVDTIVDAAAGTRLAGASALREALRRRRAEGGPAEQTFATLVGLEMRPRRLRDAATLWWGLTDQVGPAGRDGVWDAPDLLPTAADLDDPLDYARRVKAANDVSPDDAASLIEAFEALTAQAASGSGDAEGPARPAGDGSEGDETRGEGPDGPTGR
ncbi:zinc-dependent metalloprotease [Jatrophihabitans sp. YIM 134969]